MSEERTLETERLRLRWLTLDDAELMLAIWNDPAFIRHVGDRGIRTIEEARTAMAKGALQLYEKYGYGPYRMALRDDDTAIGICGLFRRDNLDDPDIGYGVLPEYCGKGYAYEGSRAVMQYARLDLALERVIAIISPDNEASIGLIRNLGLRFERMHRMHEDEDEVCIYGVQLAG
jgi:ribosomal-protein-alanine N-acetyltransferase